MRFALTAAALAASAALSACGSQADEGPERGSAAGEVLGGEVTDDMLPLDTVRSTSPPDPRSAAPAAASDSPAPAVEAPGELPVPEVSGGPGQRQPVGIEPADEPPPE